MRKSWVDRHGALLLEYLLGEKDGYVLVVPAGGTPRVELLSVTPQQAQVLGIEAGPLTADRLQQALANSRNTGVLQRLRSPAESDIEGRANAPGLAVLWEVLVPAGLREKVLADAFQRLVIVPDGPLAHFPFEALAVQSESEPRYLLDAAAPVVYSPSATVLLTLASRPNNASRTEKPVLSVGNPSYNAVPRDKQRDISSDSPPAGPSRFATNLAPLPFTAWETAWVAEVFGKQGIGATVLVQADATEPRVRQSVSGRRVVHIACHGLADADAGNLFGALALSPGGDSTDLAADGFLTLSETYELSLQGCEMAILSACQTNFGPQQRGEGVWALSRGFLVAGARRVVASNWLVDDEAAASIVSYFCGRVASAEREGKTPDYAQSLQQAKRWGRANKKWKHPYYWATFVLVGPH